MSRTVQAWLHVGVVLAVMTAANLAGLNVLWPLPLLLGLGASALVGRLPALRGSVDWYVRGRLSRTELLLGAATAVIAPAALLAWFALADPDISDITARVPAWPLPVLAALALVFSVLNACAEEAGFRGALHGALDRTLPPGAGPIVIQAVLFGLGHSQGFPRGPSGMALAAIYGLALGLVRHVSGGLLAAIVTHVTTDLVIFAIVAWTALAS